MPKTLDEKGNKLLADAHRVAKGPSIKGQADCSLMVPKSSSGKAVTSLRH